MIVMIHGTLKKIETSLTVEIAYIYLSIRPSVHLGGQ